MTPLLLLYIQYIFKNSTGVDSNKDIHIRGMQRMQRKAIWAYK